MSMRLRAAEKMLETNVKEKVKFLEGAQWISQKLHIDVQNLNEQIGQVLREFMLEIS